MSSDKYSSFFDGLKMIVENKKIESDLAHVEITHLKHEEEDFYCLTVPTGAFVVKHNGVESVSGNCHSLGGATAFLIAVKEMREDGTLSQDKYNELSTKIREAANILGEHEFRIVDMIFEKGDKDNMKESMKQFVRSRVNLCLQNLMLPSIYSYDDIGENKIATTFYKNLILPQIHDFFQNLGSQYHRDYKENDFKIEPNKYVLEM